MICRRPRTANEDSWAKILGAGANRFVLIQDLDFVAALHALCRIFGHEGRHLYRPPFDVSRRDVDSGLSTAPNESPTTRSPVRMPIRHFIAAVKAVFSLLKKRAPSGFVLQ
jgi:hypothetical protein